MRSRGEWLGHRERAREDETWHPAPAQRSFFLQPQMRNLPNLVGGRLSAMLFLPFGTCGAVFVPRSRLQSSIIGGAAHPFGVPGTGVQRPLLSPHESPFVQAHGSPVTSSGTSL
jgi:hypothetical protein